MRLINLLQFNKTSWCGLLLGLLIFQQPVFSFAAEISDPKAPVAVVLVPGVLNVLIPAFTKNSTDSVYFAADIQDQFHKVGIKTHVVKNLLPTGDLYENSQRTLNDIELWYKKAYPKGDTQIVLVGHSSGGLYSMRAAQLNTILPIKKIIGISTPIEGTQLASAFGMKNLNALFSTSPGKLVSRYIDLRGLAQMAPELAQAFRAKTFKCGFRVLSKVPSGRPVPESLHQS